MKKQPINEYSFEEITKAVSWAVVLITILIFLLVIFTLIAINLVFPVI